VLAAIGKGHTSFMDSEFGFLINPLKGEFLGVAISPLPDHPSRLEAIQKESNKDGFFYPPQIALYNLDIKTRKPKKKIARSDRPASVFFLPSSHQISIQNPICKDGEKGTDEALIVFLLAYLHGTRLMPRKFRFDGRVPMKPVSNFYISDAICLHFMEHVYSWWKTLSENQRVKFVNILYVFNRAKSLEWDWDVFLHQYMIFDALYNFHIELQPNKKAKNHKDRFNILCNQYSAFNEDTVNRICKARNDLFHEAMWVESTIGFGSLDRDAYQLPFHLARLNARLICGISGYKNQFIQTPWWVMGKFEFNKM
jgi:hypothetical protein